MTAATTAWSVVQIAELMRAGDALLLRAMRALDVDARAAMPEDAAWVLGGGDAEDLRGLLCEHGDVAERLRMLVEQLPEHGVTATYDDVRDGAAAALADGILDPTGVVMTASALDVPVGWAALADALASTDARSAWTELGVAELLGAFRGATAGLLGRVLAEAAVAADASWADLTVEEAHRLADTLRACAERS